MSRCPAGGISINLSNIAERYMGAREQYAALVGEDLMQRKLPYRNELLNDIHTIAKATFKGVSISHMRMDRIQQLCGDLELLEGRVSILVQQKEQLSKAMNDLCLAKQLSPILPSDLQAMSVTRLFQLYQEMKSAVSPEHATFRRRHSRSLTPPSAPSSGANSSPGSRRSPVALFTLHEDPTADEAEAKPMPVALGGYAR